MCSNISTLEDYEYIWCKLRLNEQLIYVEAHTKFFTAEAEYDLEMISLTERWELQATALEPFKTTNEDGSFNHDLIQVAEKYFLTTFVETVKTTISEYRDVEKRLQLDQVQDLINSFKNRDNLTAEEVNFCKVWYELDN